MLRRLLLGYLGLLLVVLAAFGVPLGMLWASHSRADALGALQQSATEAGTALAAPLQQALADRQAAGRGPDTDGGALLAGLRLTPSQQASVTDGLADFADGSRTLVALLRGDGRVVDAVGTARAVAGRLIGRKVLEQVMTETGTPTTGQGSAGRARLVYAVGPVRVPATSVAGTAAVSASSDGPGVAVGAVLVGEPAGVLDATVGTIAASLAALGAAILVLAALAGWALVRSLVRPLSKIGAAVADLGGGDLAARAPTGEGPPELLALAETVNEMATRMGELIGAQRAFVADASHQLRTPLTALRLRLEGLAAGEPTPPDELGAILGEVERLTRLVTGLLGLARAEEAPGTPEATDVAELLASRGEAWLGVAEEQGIGLVYGGSGPARALAVAADLEQALDNLLDNALRAAPSGSAVRLEVTEEDGWVALHVIDEGPGMPADDRRHAFDRFWTRRAEAGGGSGLGLAIADRLVRNSGGDVELRDVPGGVGIDAVVRVKPV